jgi:tRNA nucleotidyltransferase (CCA-adding enzyme)
MKEFELPQYVADIMAVIEEVGFEAYLVGGCVRDALLRQQPSDYDIATSASPEDVARIFEKTVPTGLKYGTVTVLTHGKKAEVTTFRSEAGYDDARRPNTVTFGGGILNDLSRRDFTVNAMAYNPQTGIVDPFDGRSDLKKHIIRAVGKPDERFNEDALRILRAFRFAAQLGFELEEGTLRAAGENMALCSRLSGERVRAELDRLLLSERPSLVFMLVRMGLFDAVGALMLSPENERRLDDVPASLPARWAAFYFMSGRPCESLFERLKFENINKKNIIILLSELDESPPRARAEIKRRLRRVPPPLFTEYLQIIAALKGQDVSAALEELGDILKTGEPYKQDMVALSGDDLMKSGFKQGPEIGRKLSELLDYVIENPEENNKSTLLKLFKINNIK